MTLWAMRGGDPLAVVAELTNEQIIASVHARHTPRGVKVRIDIPHMVKSKKRVRIFLTLGDWTKRVNLSRDGLTEAKIAYKLDWHIELLRTASRIQ